MASNKQNTNTATKSVAVLTQELEAAKAALIALPEDATEEVKTAAQKAVDDAQKAFDTAITETEVVEKETTPVFKSESGAKYEITVKEFRFKGNLYKSADAIKDNKEVFEMLIEANSFILKKL